jgi:hypothetical protein
MASTRKPGSQGRSAPGSGVPARTPGSLGVNDQADPNVQSLLGDTPGPVGYFDLGDPGVCYDGPSFGNWANSNPMLAPAPDATPNTTVGELSDEAVSGAVPVGVGAPSVVRIPVPGASGLYVELTPRGWRPKTGSTSRLFIQDTTGKRHLRLDYDYNKTTGKVDYHWNQEGTRSKFGITDHTPTGKGGEALYKGAKYLKYGGRVLIVAGAAADAYSIVVAKKKLRQTTKVLAGWAGATAGCKLVGAGAAAVGTVVEPGGGTAVGAILGCVVGGVGGYAGASWVAEEAYDWVEETFFEPLPEVPQIN